MSKAGLLILVAVLSVFFTPETEGQDTIKIKRYVSAIEFDGRPFEDAWNNLDDFHFTMHQPDFGREPLEKSEVMITYDNEYLWVGARLYMQDAKKITITSKKRDDNSEFFDSFDIALDTYNDNENSLLFHTKPSGLRADYSIANDGVFESGFVPFNLDWNTFWDVKTSIDDKGWYAEMRIPFSSLKFKPENNITTMGLIMRRFISYNHGMDTYPALDPKFGSKKPSKAATIQFEDIQPSNPVYVSPYLTGGYTRNWVENSESTGYEKDNTPQVNAGLDVKYNINSNLTLDLTANTDFAQVEADDQQVNLTRYSLYFPEKRMFFQERSNLFSYSLGGRSNLFYSRNIGLSKGKSIRIYGGARLAGRIGKWDIGLLDMQTEKQGETQGENFGVFRMRRQVINSNSYVGGMFTSRVGMNGAHNLAYGVDWLYRVFGNDYLELKAAQTYDDVTDNEILSVDPMYLSVKWERRTVRSFSYNLNYTYSGRQFNPGIGYVNRGSLKGLSGKISYGWLPGRESRLFNIMAELSASRYMRLSDDKMESLSLLPAWSIETKSGYKTSLSVEYQQEGVLFNFPITDSISVMAGNYEFANSVLSFQTPAGKHVSVTLTLNAGGFYNGKRYGFSIKPSFNVSPSLQLSGSYQFDNIRFPGPHKQTNIHIASARVLYMLNTKLSTSLFIQYNSTNDDLISNFRIRFNPHEGNDFYLVFNDYRCVDDEELVPALPDYYSRTILLKYTHTFRL
jgi:hypothetical protein